MSSHGQSSALFDCIVIGFGGVGSAAICLACRYAFDALSLSKLTAGMYADNPGSRRAFEKAGFRHEAVLSRHYVSAGRVVDGILMARFADDPEP